MRLMYRTACLLSFAISTGAKAPFDSRFKIVKGFKTMTNNDLQVRIEKNIKMAIDRLNDSNAFKNDYTRFINNGMECFIVATSGGYHVIYDNSHDRLVVAWLVRLYGHEFMGDTLNVIGDWGQGYYFNNNGGNDLMSRYEIEKVARMFIKKALS